jgi:hypothetical protein
MSVGIGIRTIQQNDFKKVVSFSSEFVPAACQLHCEMPFAR